MCRPGNPPTSKTLTTIQPDDHNSMDTNSPKSPVLDQNASQPLNDVPRSDDSQETWLYPNAFANELQSVPELPEATIRQTLAVAWEYTRSVIPVYTNRSRYLAFIRLIIVGIVAEFNGALVDISHSDAVLGYDLAALFTALFPTSPPLRDAMARDYRTFILTTAEKTSGRQSSSELFRRYTSALAESPKAWFRIRDADAIVRFSLAAALACNDVMTEEVWFAEEQLQVLAEVGCTLYDAVAFYKHRAEGETNDTFAYVDPGLRAEAYRRAREVLWALDVAWAEAPEYLPVLNFLRPFGGPIHMTMGRYRFVEEGLTIGRPETEDVIFATRRHVKLWNRVDWREEGGLDDGSYREAIRQSDRLLFDGLSELLQRQEPGRQRCDRCRYRMAYGAQRLGEFGGVELCSGCNEEWRLYIESLPRRAAEAFPELRGTQIRLGR
ncbi:BcABA3 [Coniochaeta sp. 2T2.1]|nr:BcABA3 [Coniochaeta sp. 2T2.1]